MFAGGCGRVFEGTYEQMFDSLVKLKKLCDEYAAMLPTVVLINAKLPIEKLFFRKALLLIKELVISSNFVLSFIFIYIVINFITILNSW